MVDGFSFISIPVGIYIKNEVTSDVNVNCGSGMQNTANGKKRKTNSATITTKHML